MVLHTLHEAEDIADLDDAFADVPTGKTDAKMVQLASELIERQTGDYAPGDLEDRYDARLREIIDARSRAPRSAPTIPSRRTGQRHRPDERAEAESRRSGKRAGKAAKPAAKQVGAAAKQASAKAKPRKAPAARPQKRAAASRARKR